MSPSRTEPSQSPGRRRATAPLALGLLAAAAAFVVLGALAGGEDRRSVSAPDPPARDAVAAGGAVFARMGCGGCHRLAAARADGWVGPDLDQRLERHDRASLTATIVAPPASGGFAVMPTDYEERLTRSELDDLVTFLLDAGGERQEG